MDLEDGIISGQTKLKVQEIVERPIQRLVKHRFQTMFLEDKMYIPYLILIVGYTQHLID